MPTAVTIELFLEGAWRPAAEVRLRRGLDRREPTSLRYDIDYALEHMDARDWSAVSTRFPVDLDIHDLPIFPAICVDLMPQGIPRRRIERELEQQGLPAGDWGVLLRAGSPIGNLRIPDEAPPVPPRGVTRAEVVRRGETFHAWAVASGIPTRGATDTVGASPKLLMTEDGAGLLHADGALDDDQAKRHWLIKFPRGRSVRDQQVLAFEPAYLEVARRVGLRVAEPLHHESGALFVPRFDRVVTAGGVVRYGLESVYSLMGVVDAGAVLRWEDAIAAVAGVVDDPASDVVELVARDALALALGNTDNHGRNTAVRKGAGSVAVSPLFDFAPMFLDPELVTRTTLWDSERRPGAVDWRAVVASVDRWSGRERLVRRLLDLSGSLADAAEWLRELGVDDEIVALVRPRIDEVRGALRLLEG